MNHFDTIRTVHPDLDEITRSFDFEGWLLRQPPEVQRLKYTGNAEQVIDMLTRYKREFGLLPKPKPTFTRQQIARMSPEEFARREPEIDKAIADGRVRR